MIGKHMRFKRDSDIHWNEGPIHILGLSICNTEAENIKYNFEPRLKKISTIFNIWRQRNLSLKGKITIINSLAASLLIYPCSTLLTPQVIIKEIDKIFFNFLWNGNTNKIAKNTVIRKIDDGGLKMIDFESKIKTLKLTWIKRAITNPTSSRKLIIDQILNDIPFDYLIRCSCTQNKYLHKLPIFYKEIIENLNILREHKKLDMLQYSEIINETIWLNEHVTVDRKPYFLKKMVQQRNKIHQRPPIRCKWTVYKSK